MQRPQALRGRARCGRLQHSTHPCPSGRPRLRAPVSGSVGYFRSHPIGSCCSASCLAPGSVLLLACGLWSPWVMVLRRCSRSSCCFSAARTLHFAIHLLTAPYRTCWAHGSSRWPPPSLSVMTTAQIWVRARARVSIPLCPFYGDRTRHSYGAGTPGVECSHQALLPAPELLPNVQQLSKPVSSRAPQPFCQELFTSPLHPPII